MKTLYSIFHSPWSERARFALLHHAIDFEERKHVPLIGEIPLRFRARKWRGKISVPLLIDGDETVQGSLAIAEHVDAIGENTPLFPQEHREAIRRFYDEIEGSMEAARERFVEGLSKNKAAQLESAPDFFRALGLSGVAVNLGRWFITNKYDATRGSALTRIREGLLRVREVLAKKDYVFGAFSFADIMGASLIQAIQPCDTKYLAVSDAMRDIWEYPPFVSEFADLVTWRDRIYEKHRPLG